MEEGTASEEDQSRENNDNAHDCLRDMASINEENLIANSPTDICSDCSVTSNNTASLPIVNTDNLCSYDSENKSKCKNSLTCCGDCNDNGSARKISPECGNYTNISCSHKFSKVNVDSDNDLRTLEESYFSQGDTNDSVSRKNKSNPFSQHHISNCSIDEDSNSAACEVLGNRNETYNAQGNKNVLLSDELKKDGLECRDVCESSNFNEVATVLDDAQNKNDKKCPVAAEQIKDETNTLHSVVGASEFPLEATSIVSGSQMSVNSDLHEGKPKTNLACPLELTTSSTKYSCSNNNNILSSSSSDLTWTSESGCHQQMGFNTTSFNGTSPGFTNANMATFQSNTDKTKVSFSFPLNNESNFNFRMNDAFSNMPASKNSFQIKECNTNTNKSTTGTSSVASSTSSYKTSVGLYERQTDILRSSPNSQISTVPTFQTPYNLNIFKVDFSSIKLPLFGMSTDCTFKSPFSAETPKGLNSHTSENSGNESSMPLSSKFKKISKTESSVAQNSEPSDTKNTSSSFSGGSSTSFLGCAKNLFPNIGTNTISFQSSSRPTNDVKNVETLVSLEKKASVFSFGSPGTSSSIFPAIPVSQQSPSIIKSPTYTFTSTLKSPIIKSSKLDGNGRAFQSSLFGSASLDNTQTTYSESSNLFGKCNTTPLFGNYNTAPVFNTSAKSPFGSSAYFPNVESSQESFGMLFHSKPSASSGLSKSETSANEKPDFNFGCTSKRSDTEQFLLECNTSLKSSQVDATESPFSPSSNPFSIKLTPNIKGFNFGTSSTKTNFNFGSSSMTPSDSPFIFKCSEKGKKSKPRSNLRKFAEGKSNFNNNPEIPKIPFRVVIDTDTYVKNNGVIRTINAHYQCITTMPEYSSFSFEELRFHYDKYNSNPLLPTETYTITMISKTTQTTETTQDHLIDIWKALECPVCLEIVTPPVQQCEQGHHVCNNCWKKITSCPLCKRYRKQTRNYVAEAMVEKLPLPCKYRVDGCMRTMQQKEKNAHEEKCKFRTYNCLVQDCNQAHNFKDMIVHLKTAHRHLMTPYEGSLHSASWTVTKYEFKKLVHVFEMPCWGLFFLCHKTSDQNNYLWMQMINADGGTSGKGFFCSVEVGDIKDRRSVSYKGPVFPMHSTINENLDCLIISDNLLSSLKDLIICVKISIWKKQS